MSRSVTFVRGGGGHAGTMPIKNPPSGEDVLTKSEVNEALHILKVRFRQYLRDMVEEGENRERPGQFGQFVHDIEAVERFGREAPYER